MKKKVWIIIAAVVLVIIVGATLRGGNRPDAEVQADDVTMENLTAIVNCSGTIQPKRSVDVSANVSDGIVSVEACAKLEEPLPPDPRLTAVGGEA